MSVSVTISGQDSISVVSSTPLVNTLEVSSNVVLNALNTATGVLNTATGTLREDISNVSGLITSNDSDISNLQTSTGLLSVATGNLDTKIITVSGLINSNDSEIAALNSATGVLNTNITGLQTATGSLKSDISSNDSDISVLQNATGSLKSDIFSNDSDISNLQTATGLLKTATGNLDSKIITVSGLITSNDAELTALNTATGVLTTATGNLDSKIIAVSGLIVSNDSDITSLNAATGTLNTNIIGLQNATGSLKSDISSNDSSISALQTATGSLKSDISSNDSDIVALKIATGILDVDIASNFSTLRNATGVLSVELQNSTGSLKSDIASNDSDIASLQTATGLILTSGEINTNINTAIANLVDSAPGTLNTLNELAAALGDDANFSTTTASSLSTLQTATGVLNTNVLGLQTATGSLKSDISSNDSDILALQIATGLLQGATGALEIVTGFFAQTGRNPLVFGAGGVSVPNGTISAPEASFVDIGGTLTTVAQQNITSLGILSGIDVGGVGYQISDVPNQSKHWAKFQNNILKLGDHLSQGYALAIYGNGGIEVMRITGDGGSAESTRIGIGTDNPQAKLHVTGDTILNGHVGIGSSTPQFPLDINGTNSTTGSTIRIGQNNGGTAIRIGAGGGSSDVVLMRVDGSTHANLHDGITDSGAFGFSMKYMGSESSNSNALRIISDNQSGTPVNALNILQDGNIGLNTVSPAARLHVNGNTILSGTLTVTNDIDGELGRAYQPNITQVGTLTGLSVGTNASQEFAQFNIETFNVNAGGGDVAIANGTISAANGTISATSGLFARITGKLTTASQQNITSLGVLTGLSVSDASANAQFTVDTFNVSASNLALNDGRFSIGAAAGNCFTINDNAGGTNFINANINNKIFAIDGDLRVAGDIGVTGDATVSGGLNITGNVGIGTTSPQAKLSVVGGNMEVGETSENVDRKITIHSQNAFHKRTDIGYVGTVFGIRPQIGHQTFVFGSNSINNMQFKSDANAGIMKFSTSGTEKLRIDNVGVGIGTTTPQAKLHVSGDTILSGVLTVTGDISSPSITSLNTATGLLVQKTETGNFALLNQDTVFQGTLESPEINCAGGDGYVLEGKQFAQLDEFLKLGDHDGGNFATALFSNGGTEAIRITGGNVGIGTTTPNVKLYVNAGATNSIATFQSSDDKAVINIRDNDTNAHLIAKDGKLSIGSSTSDVDKFNVNITNGDTTIAGTTTVGKITLSENSFVTETGSFTLGATHKGATVLLQNSSGINISIPSQVSGYVTTFIAETHNSVSFITGVGMSGLNSFQGASDIAGIFGQAQVIFKSPEYAFLGGNVV